MKWFIFDITGLTEFGRELFYCYGYDMDILLILYPNTPEIYTGER